MLKRLISILAVMFLCVSIHAQGHVVKPHYMKAEAYPAHVHLKWENRNQWNYDVYRYDEAKDSYVLLAETTGKDHMDFSIGKSDRDRNYTYRICPEGFSPYDSEMAGFEVKTVVPAASDEALLDMVQKYTTYYFSEYAHPVVGLARERSNDLNGDIVTTGGTGFGMMALVAGASRGYVTDAQVIDIFTKIVTFLEDPERRFHGAWAHWYDADTGKAFSFSKYDDGGDLVETAFLVAGILTARQWLTENERDLDLAKRCDRLWNTVEWSWYTQKSKDALYWHWSKNHGWKMNHKLKGFDETLITYILAASSKKYSISREVYESCFKNSEIYENPNSYYGIPMILGMPYGGPLFFTHYSFLGMNPNGLRDEKVDYFERNRNHTLIHYNYAIDNPKGHKGLGKDFWGFTSSDDALVGYTSHHPNTEAENGTVSPTAAISSIVYTPEESMQVIRHLYYDLGEEMFGKYGFYDSYNPSMCEGQRAVRSYLAIDQGTQPVMIENYRTGLIWDYFMSCPEVQKGLKKLGFETKY